MGRFPLDRRGYEGGEFIVLIVLPGDRERDQLWSEGTMEEGAGIGQILSFPSMPQWPGIHTKIMFVL